MNPWLNNLNPEQQQAVLHDHGPLLILAGAGSGKTTVLVSRTGRLIAEKLAQPERVCVLTFTNKAAHELKLRVAGKLGQTASKVWAGTFHGFGLQFLKEHYKEAELPRGFGVIDSGDSQAVIKDLLKDHRAVEKNGFVIEKLLQKMSVLRETKKESSLDDSIESSIAIVLLPKYLKRLRSLGVVDFEDLLLRPLQMMKLDSLLKSKMQGRYDFVMVDEFQDTNSTQMLLVDTLTEAHRNIAVVGDDDQSIYGWRGAQIRNILDFPKRYSKCQVIRLERNYRSTEKILNLANAIIAANKNRHKKVLKPSLNNVGDLPELFTYANEEAEVDAITNELLTAQKRGYQWKDIAILYRANTQGGLIEGGLRRAQIPYKITGGTALFDRKEVKDVLAFIRCSLFPNEISLRRIINLPARGIGEKTIEEIENFKGAGPLDFAQKTKLWAKNHPEEKSSQSILSFFKFLEDLKTGLIHSNLSAEDSLQQELEKIGYRKLVFESFKDPKAGEGRWLGVVILGRILNGMFDSMGRTIGTLEKFMDNMELRDRVEQDDNSNQVQLMTLHACKGLEFPLVFLLGLEEDLLPHARLGQDTDEERRLFYVGVTRAKKHLILTRVRERKRYGKIQLITPSRFLMELEKSLYADLGPGRALAQDERKSMMADLFKKLDKKIAEREPM